MQFYLISVMGRPILSCRAPIGWQPQMGTDVSCGVVAAATVSSGEGDLCLLAPRKAEVSAYYFAFYFALPSPTVLMTPNPPLVCDDTSHSVEVPAPWHWPSVSTFSPQCAVNVLYGTRLIPRAGTEHQHQRYKPTGWTECLTNPWESFTIKKNVEYIYFLKFSSLYF